MDSTTVQASSSVGGIILSCVIGAACIATAGIGCIVVYILLRTLFRKAKPKLEKAKDKVKKLGKEIKQEAKRLEAEK